MNEVKNNGIKRILILLISIPGALLLFGGLSIRAFVASYDSALIQAIRNYSDLLVGSSTEVDIVITVISLNDYAPWIIATGIVWLVLTAIIWNRSGKSGKTKK